MPEKPRRIEAGLYEHPSGRLIVRTEWEGPQGGRFWLWEHATRDRGGLVVNGGPGYRTLREAVRALDS